jgi:hypothetical protein
MNCKAGLNVQGRVSSKIGWYLKQVVALFHIEEKEESGKLMEKEIKVIKVIGPIGTKRQRKRNIKIN